LEGYFAAERKGESPLWEEWSLKIGTAIADGKMVIDPPPPLPALVALFPDDPLPGVIQGQYLQTNHEMALPFGRSNPWFSIPSTPWDTP